MAAFNFGLFEFPPRDDSCPELRLSFFWDPLEEIALPVSIAKNAPPRSHNATKKAARLHTGCVEMDPEAVRALYGVPLRKAAVKLGVSDTALKMWCRAHGILSWPYRQLFSLENFRDACTLAMRRGPEDARLSAAVERINGLIVRLVQTGDAVMPPDMHRFRSTLYKALNKQRV